MENIRLYGSPITVWTETELYTVNGHEYSREVTVQVERPYREYATDGRLICTGTEDFSRERDRGLKNCRVFVWDGYRRNRGGHRWFEETMFCRFYEPQRKALREYLKSRYPEAGDIRLQVF